VTTATLDPRPDTETLIDAALALMPRRARILDLGTGTGAIAITLLAERPDASAVATDISPAALAVAAENAERSGVAERLGLIHGSWFEPVTGVFDIIVSNPPYIPAGDIAGLSPDVRNFDPILALVGGADGLDPYRAISACANRHLAEAGHVLVEIGAGQADEVAAIFAAAGFGSPERHRDLGGHMRCLAFGLSR
jgi:release factor glutamine methyltransferase